MTLLLLLRTCGDDARKSDCDLGIDGGREPLEAEQPVLAGAGALGDRDSASAHADVRTARLLSHPLACGVGIKGDAEAEGSVRDSGVHGGHA